MAAHVFEGGSSHPHHALLEKAAVRVYSTNRQMEGNTAQKARNHFTAHKFMEFIVDLLLHPERK